MKRLSIASTALAVLLSGPVLAADLPTAKGPPPAPMAYVPAFTWTGFYVGVNAGYAWGDSNTRYGYAYQPYSVPVLTDAAAARDLIIVNPYYPWFSPDWATPYGWPASFGNNANGFTGGLQAGYNFQFGSFVVGIEGDINWLNASKSASWYNSGDWGTGAEICVISAADVAYCDGTWEAGLRAKTTMNWFGTLRGRAGVAFDRALIYVTGGLAFGNIKGSTSGYFNAYGFPVEIIDVPALAAVGVAPPGADQIYGSVWAGSKSSTQVGWTVGVGAEYAITNNWTVKLEYLYYDLGDISYTVAGTYGTYGFPGTGLGATGVNYFTASHEVTGNIVRAGVNYKF
jgi:outer membrane immunogenic protein